MSFLDDEDEGDVPPLLDMCSMDLNAKATTAQSAVETRPPTATAVPVPAREVPTKPAQQKSRPPVERGGLKKGFLGGGSSSGGKAVVKGATPGDSADLPEVKADRQQKQKSLQLPEVQQHMAAERAASGTANVNGGQKDNSWVTPELLQKIGANPVLRKAFTDPRCQEAMTALQTDPQAAMRKYGDNAEIREFLQAFMKLMGSHFTELADKEDAAGGGKHTKRATPAGGGAPAGGAAPTVVTRPTPASPLITPTKSDEEHKAEAAVEQAMRDPEVVAILQEPAVQALLAKLQAGHAHELDAAARKDPTLVSKLRKLSQAGLIGMHWAP